MQCGKERQVAKKIQAEKKVLQYNKNLHDHRYYFPNRCYSCEHYSNSHGEPESGSDIIFCNIFGGGVEAEAGCVEFKADITAGCEGCWNLSIKNQGQSVGYICALKGPIQDLVWGGCYEHVRKERTDQPLPAVLDAISKNKAFLASREYPYDQEIRRAILDAMQMSGIDMASEEKFSIDQRCATCNHEFKIHGNYGECRYHGIGMLCYTGANPYGYEESICSHYSRKLDLPVVIYPKLHIDTLSNNVRALNNNYHIAVESGSCSVMDSRNNKVICTYSDIDDMPRFMQYNEKNNCIDLYFCEGSVRELLLNSSVPPIISVNSKDWIDVDEDEMFKAVTQVSLNQRQHNVYTGTNIANCERCKFVDRNYAYPEGSPTGLVCTEKKIFVTANGCCDYYLLKLTE